MTSPVRPPGGRFRRYRRKLPAARWIAVTRRQRSTAQATATTKDKDPSPLRALIATVLIASVLVAPERADAYVAAPDPVPALRGYSALWAPTGSNSLHGTVLDSATLQHNDHLVSWINTHATDAQRFRALQDSAYLNADGTGYDQSLTISDGLGGFLGSVYVHGRISGALPRTTALLNTSTGSSGAFVGTGTAKGIFSYPRPFLPADPAANSGSTQCPAATVNGSSLKANRVGKPWADPTGNLNLFHVADTVDRTRTFATSDVYLGASWGIDGLCKGGSFPSGHTASAYQAGITLATLVPELAPQVLARTSEAANNRIVLGVHYPLDVIGGRMVGELSVAARWADADYRRETLLPARAELRRYLRAACREHFGTSVLRRCVKADTSYRDDPYAGATVPGGTAQTVADRKGAIDVYTWRLSYDFAPTSSTAQAASVPAGAESLLSSTFPFLNDEQRRSVLAQTEIAAGQPLDTTAANAADPSVPGSWQRLNLAAAMSARVVVRGDGSVVVVSTGGRAQVRRSLT